MSQIIYDVSGLKQVYDDRTVLDVPALQIKRGDVLVLVGPSGSGKSTLLRLLAMLEAPSQGVVRFHSKSDPVTFENATVQERRQLAMVFQRPVLLSRSVSANVAYGLRVRGERKIDDRVETALKRVSLQHLANARPRTLSGGEMQRVAIARSLILEPDVLLLDEPTANLDPYNVRLIEEILTEQNSNYGTTIILVTHNVFQARRLANRVGLIHESHLVEIAPTETFFESPRDPRTRSFISGDMVW